MAVESCGHIQRLPEDCVANIMSFTTPMDACRLALLGSTFRSACESDSLWEGFLPTDYLNIVSNTVGGSDSFLRNIDSKKDLYFYLCDHPILINGGRKESFSLDKRSGKKCYMVGARDLLLKSEINNYCEWVSCPKSRFSEVARFLGTYQVEMGCKIDANVLSSGTRYAAYFVFAFNSAGDGICYPPLVSCVWQLGEEKTNKYLIPLRQRHIRYRHNLKQPLNKTNKELGERMDGWMEAKIGQCFVEGGEDSLLSIFFPYLQGYGCWNGLVLEGIEFRPIE